MAAEWAERDRRAGQTRFDYREILGPELPQLRVAYRTGRTVAAHLKLCRQCGMKATAYEVIKEALPQQATATHGHALDRLAAFVEESAHTDTAGGPEAA